MGKDGDNDDDNNNIRRSRFCKDHRNKKEVPDPLVFTYVSFPVFFYDNMIVTKSGVLNKVKLKLKLRIYLAIS